MKSLIIQALQKIVKELTDQEIPINLETPPDPFHGDYTTNVAFLLAKILKKSPMQIAEEITSLLTPLFLAEGLGEVRAVSGFINFWLPKEELIKNLNYITLNIASQRGPFLNDSMLGQKIAVEFTDPNPFKEFHIGHLYTNTVGESLCRLLESQGAVVWRADYFGDVGMHIAKSLYGISRKFKANPRSGGSKFNNIEELKKVSLEERIKFMGECYAYGSTVYEEDKNAAEEIKKYNKYIYIAAQRMWQEEKNIVPRVDYQKGENPDKKTLDWIYKAYVIGRTWSLEYFEAIYKRMGMHFDGYYPESIAGERGYKLVNEHLKDGIFQEHDGAIIFSKETHGLHTRVFINSLGLPTYEAKELGLAPWKYEEFPYDFSIILTGNEITEYFKVLVKALTLINPDLGKKTRHIGHGMVRLPEGKMSSRTGKIITGEWLLNKAIKKAEKLGKRGLEQNERISPQEIQETSEQVGIGAVKYAFLKSSIGKDIEFDLETSVSLDGNSGPYIQYTFARTQSILEKSSLKEVDSGHTAFAGITGRINNKAIEQLNNEEILLLRGLYQFSQVVEKAAKTYSPNVVCEYLFELSREFNNFYQKYRILGIKNGEIIKIQQFRLFLTAGVGVVLDRGLGLLGIAALKRM